MIRNPRLGGLRRHGYHYILVLCSLAVLFYHLRVLLTDRALAGWDLTPHFYLYRRALQLLSEGRFFGYDPMWLAGYPEFTLYAPLSYIYLGALHFISFGAVSPEWSFNLGLFLLPFVFLRSVFFTARALYGRSVAFIAVPIATIFLCSGRDYYIFGYNISGLLAGGLVPAFCGMCLISYFIGFVALDLRQRSKLSFLRVGISYALLLLTHLLSFCFASFVLAILLCGRRYRLRALAVGLFALVVSSWWLWRFFEHFGLQSGEGIGAVGIAVDPLLGIFPDLVGRANVEQGAIWTSLLFRLPHIVVCLCLLAFTAFGLKRLIARRRIFLPAIFLVGIVVLPRQLLFALTGLPLHYYRFIQPLALVALLLAAVGAAWLMRWAADSTSPRSHVLLGALRWATLPCLLLVSGSLFSIEGKLLTAGGSRSLASYHLFQSDYPDVADAWKMVAYIKELQPEGRVAVEGTVDDFMLLGSPHFFMTVLPMQAHLPVINGLLVESSPSAPFLTAALSVHSGHMGWGQRKLLAQPDFTEQWLGPMMRRLALFNVQYVLATSSFYQAGLNSVPGPELYLEKQIGRFRLYRVANTAARIEVSSYRPFAYVEEGGMPFRSFAEQWYKDLELLDRPVIALNKAALSGSAEILSHLSGIIVGSGENSLSASEYAWWLSLGKPLIFLNDSGFKADNKKLLGQIQFIAQFSDSSGWRELGKAMRAIEYEPPRWSAIEPSQESGSHIRFNAHGSVRLGYSYSPRWKTVQGISPVYFATPSTMLTFADGEVDLEYR